MNKEQNIDDILKLLKDSVNTSQTTETVNTDVKSENISTEILQEQLKNQYISNADSTAADGAPNSEYVIDSDFMNEALQSSEQLPEEPIEETEAVEEVEKIEEIDEVDDVEEIEEISQTVIAEEPQAELIEQEIIIDDTADEQEDIFDNDIMPPLTEVVPEIDPVLEETEDEVEALTAIVLDDTDNASIDEEQNTVAEEAEVVAEESEAVDEEILPEVEPSAPAPEPHETFLASMRKIGMDFTTDDIYNSSMKNASLQELEEEEASKQEPIIDEPLDPSTVNIMMQFCEQEELEETIGNKNVDDFLRFEQSKLEDTEDEPVQDSREYSDASQTDKIKERYKKQATTKLLKLIGCALIAVFAFVFELLPLFEIRLVSVLDYYSYPAVYTIIGLQFVVWATAIRYKEFWIGLKRAFSYSPTYESLVSVILAITAFYDIIMFIIVAVSGDFYPNSMYNAMAVLTLTLASLADYLGTASQMWAFGVYSSDAPKFTLHKERKNSSIGMKMYGGGLEADKSIYSVRAVDFPNGFFRSVSKTPNRSKLLTLSVVPVLVIGMLASLICIFASFGAAASCAALIVCLYALMPIALILVDILPSALVCRGLVKRGSAFAGVAASEKYADADIVVFNDLHMFKKCKTEDIGIAVYDSKVGYLALGCLNALYKKIGGPMSGMQMNLPDVFKFEHVVLRRVSQNGIEAVVDRRHSLVVGTHEYMQRYGLSFPKNETENGRLTLCVSLNGGITAKLSVKYTPEPVFEMLAERLYKEGIACTVKTLDPLINSAMISNARTLGSSPISVIHMSAKDLNDPESSRYSTDADGIICCSSRLKLAQIVVMLKRLTKVRNICGKICAGFAAAGALAFVLLLGFGVLDFVNQLMLLGYLLVELASIAAVMLIYLPTNKYFTVDALYSELEGQYQKNNTEE